MATDTEHKLQKMLALQTQGAVCLAAWLERAKISRDLQAYYRRSGWLTAIGRGAFIRPHDTVGWQGGLYALQQQASLPIHVGALTALSMTVSGHSTPSLTPIYTSPQKSIYHPKIKLNYPNTEHLAP
jgi:hypothetical protein